MRRKNDNNSKFNSGDYERKKLEVNLSRLLAISLGITIVIYGLTFLVKTSFIGILLYERGFTQYLAVWLAAIVATFIFIKFIIVRREFSYLRKIGLPDTVNFFDNFQSQDVFNLQKNLVRTDSLVGIRCSRVLGAYSQSGNRKTAAELAIDDSSFYLSSSEASYAFPRILVWAIPLMGFIGTVVGISSAVNGFSGFLEKSADVEQIKKGIGVVTSGLAVAFDTTLLALLLSVLVMIPLVLMERYESRLLLAVDIFINDRLLPRFRDRSEILDEVQIDRTIHQAIQDHLPSPEALIEPAHEYAKQAASHFLQSFVGEVSKLQDLNSTFIEQLNLVNQLALQDRNSFITAWEEQQKFNHNFVQNLQILIDRINANSLEVSGGLVNQAETIKEQMNQASKLLENRLVALERATLQVSEVNQLKENLEKLIQSLDQIVILKQVLLDVQDNLYDIKPSLEKLGKPRMITFVDSEE